MQRVNLYYKADLFLYQHLSGLYVCGSNDTVNIAYAQRTRFPITVF